jgi:hypothetical protein
VSKRLLNGIQNDFSLVGKATENQDVSLSNIRKHLAYARPIHLVRKRYNVAYRRLALDTHLMLTLLNGLTGCTKEKHRGVGRQVGHESASVAFVI